jgi:hypothetical protein
MVACSLRARQAITVFLYRCLDRESHECRYAARSDTRGFMARKPARARTVAGCGMWRCRSSERVAGRRLATRRADRSARVADRLRRAPPASARPPAACLDCRSSHANAPGAITGTRQTSGFDHEPPVEAGRLPSGSALTPTRATFRNYFSLFLGRTEPPRRNLKSICFLERPSTIMTPRRMTQVRESS